MDGLLTYYHISQCMTVLYITYKLCVKSKVGGGDVLDCSDSCDATALGIRKSNLSYIKLP